MNKLRSMTEITSAINKCLKNVANNYIEVGYYLALARDEIRLHPHTYNNETIWDYAERNFELSKSTASRMIGIYEKFGEENNGTARLEAKYAKYSYSQLQELLSAPDEVAKDVTPTWTVKQIREAKRPEKKEEDTQGELVIDEHPDAVDTQTVATSQQNYKPGDWIDGTPELPKISFDEAFERGVGHLIAFDKSTESRVLWKVGRVDQTVVIPDGPRLICFDGKNNSPSYIDKLYHEYLYDADPVQKAVRMCVNFPDSECNYEACRNAKEGQDEHCPDCISQTRCCHTCDVSDCGYRCNNSKMNPEEEDPIESEPEQDDGDEDDDWTEEEALDMVLHRAQQNLMAAEEAVAPAMVTAKFKAEIAGCKLLLEQQHPDIPEQKTDQMELPRMKNNDERKKFLDEYQKWPIWVNTPEMHEKIYRYDLPNGSIIAVRECEYYATWAEKVMTRAFYYLFGENVLQFNGTHKDIEYPWSGESNVTEIVNALRDVQRKQPSDK